MELANLTNKGIATIVSGKMLIDKILSSKMLIEVNYGRGYEPFVFNGENDHQLDALGVFLSSRTVTTVTIVIVPHKQYDNFVAAFSRVDYQTVKYVKTTGAEVFFRIS